MKMLIASNNQGKLREIKEILGGIYADIVTPMDIGLALDVIEDGDTFFENAKKKAVSFMEAAGMDALADDSGLCVEALDGAPGVYSARFSGENANDESNNKLLLEKLNHIENRKAQFVSCIVLAKTDGGIISATGKSDGIILSEPRGQGGFGYDPLFFDETYQKTYAQMTPDEKNAISHRGKALRELHRIITTGEME